MYNFLLLIKFHRLLMSQKFRFQHLTYKTVQTAIVTIQKYLEKDIVVFKQDLLCEFRSLVVISSKFAFIRILSSKTRDLTFAFYSLINKPQPLVSQQIINEGGNNFFCFIILVAPPTTPPASSYCKNEIFTESNFLMISPQFPLLYVPGQVCRYSVIRTSQVMNK